MNEDKPFKAHFSRFGTQYTLQFTRGQGIHPIFNRVRETVNCDLITDCGAIYTATAYRRPGDDFNLPEARKAALTKLCKQIVNEDMRRDLWTVYLVRAGIKKAPMSMEQAA